VLRIPRFNTGLVGGQFSRDPGLFEGDLFDCTGHALVYSIVNDICTM
jgi:hypothetical protein